MGNHPRAMAIFYTKYHLDSRVIRWSEVGAQRVGIIQSLLVTCRLHEVDAYTYLVDVLQRISMHPANRAIELTPRMWKSLFVDDPLRSDLGPHNHDPPPH